MMRQGTAIPQQRIPAPGATSEAGRPALRAAEVARAADTDPVGPLWRAAQVFRLLAFLYALGFQLAVNNDLAHRALAWGLFGVLTACTIACGVAYYVGFGRNRYWVVAELLVVCGLMLSTSVVADDPWAWANQTWPTTLWATNAVISVALLAGPVWGIAAGLIVGGASTFVKGRLDLDFGRNATIIIIVATGMAVGLAAVIARRAHRVLTDAARLAAAADERERLSREVHDGVLQVLALIAKRGREIGGPTSELAELAGTQEQSLRRLIAETPEATTRPATTSADTDLGVLLRGFADGRISVSAPGTPVVVDSALADEIRAVVTNALDNVAHHAGPDARAYLLLEDLSDRVVVTVRDDGVGIAPGRLDEAQRQGRMGISRSIIGRVEALGGSAMLDTGPGMGTEWEWTIPRQRNSTREAR